MDTVSSEHIAKLLDILDELIDTIEEMLKIKYDYFLFKNKREANDWRNFLSEHDSFESFQSLKKEVTERFLFEFSFEADETELDLKRVSLMEDFLALAAKILREE